MCQGLALFQSQVAAGKWREAFASCIQLLNNWSLGKDLNHQYVLTPGVNQCQALAKVFSHHYLQLLQAKSFVLSYQDFYQLALHHHLIHRLFSLCDGLEVDAILKNFLDEFTKNNKRSSESAKKRAKHALMKAFLLFFPGNDHQAAITPLLHRDPALSSAVLFGALMYPTLIKKEDEEKCAFCFAQLGHILPNQIPLFYLPLISHAWCQISYDKRSVKCDRLAMMNRWLDQWKQNHLSPSKENISKAKGGKPTLLLVLEYFQSNHALFRSLGPAIQQLRQHFTLVGVVEQNGIDAVGFGYFDEVIEIDWRLPSDLNGIIQKIKARAPNIIYYPAVGMKEWSLVLASMRLAPIQIAAPGQAATTGMPTMDYMLVYEELFDEKAHYSEKVIVLDRDQFKLLGLPHGVVKPQVAARDERAIVVPASYHKINPDFMMICSRLQKESRVKIQFHFFPNIAGIYYHSFKDKLNEVLPNSIVYPPLDYGAYMQYLSLGDLALMPFPFGSTNGTVDCVQLKIPIVTLKGVEPFGRVDAAVLEKCGLGSKLVATNEANYFAIALRLVEDPQLRESVQQQYIEATSNLENMFAMDDEHTYYGDALRCLVAHHDKLQNSPQKVWKMGELIKLLQVVE